MKDDNKTKADIFVALVTGQPLARYLKKSSTRILMDVTELIKREGLRRGLRPKSIKTYITCFNKFLRIYRKDAREISKLDIQRYQDQMVKWNKSYSTINTHLNAIKFFYEKILKKKVSMKIKHSKVKRRIPTFLTQEETTQLFNAIKNQKHRLMIKFLYATGMRVSELVSLRVRNFQFDKNYGWVRDGKGGKDRLFIVARKLRCELLAWVSKNKLGFDDWLFPGQSNNHISTSTIQLIIKKAVKVAKIRKNVHPHTLRHSFATHLIQNGYAVTEVQPLLGHGNVNTTMIY